MFYTLRRVNEYHILLLFTEHIFAAGLFTESIVVAAEEFTDHGAGTQLFALPVPGPQYLQT